MQELTDADLKKIIARKDPRYDGRFFFGVKTTGIYCRPICPAKPKPENILIFRSQAEAEREGYRPCLRCHPALAPHSRRRNGTFSSVVRALNILEHEPDLALNTLALRLGISDRHLRRLFDEHLGASPIEILASRRLHVAFTLVSTTGASFSEIAFASGFRSVRRFNEAFKKLYHHPPIHFRNKNSVYPAEKATFRLTLPLVAPYDFPGVLAYLKRHEAYGIERVSDESYERFLPVGKSFGRIEVRLKNPNEFQLSIFGVPLTELRFILKNIKNVFDLDHHPGYLPGASKIKTNGVRVPGSFDDFETIVSIVLSQLISTEQARLKLRRLIERYGNRLGDHTSLPVFAFPTPAVLSTAPLEEIGLTRVRAQAIRDLARLFMTSPLTQREEFAAIKGFGPWTIEIIAMRCLRDPDAFPKNDLVIKRDLLALGINDQEWIPHRAYLTHCLWRDHMANLPKKITKTKSRKKYESLPPEN